MLAAFRPSLVGFEDKPRLSKQVSRIRKRGIPASCRGVMWFRLVSPPVKELELGVSPWAKSIHRDLHRTFPKHLLFRYEWGKRRLEDILISYSLHDPDLGYCQGMGFIAGMLLMYLPQSCSYSVFHKLMSTDGIWRVRGMYQEGLTQVMIYFRMLDTLLLRFDRELAEHLNEIGAHPSMYSSQWFLTLYASTFSLDLVLHILDCFLSEGYLVLFKVALAILTGNRSSFLKARTFEEFLVELKSHQDTLDPQKLLRAAFKGFHVTYFELEEEFFRSEQIPTFHVSI